MSMSTGYKLGFGPQDLLLDSLRMEKESMWLENWSCSKAERQRRWDLRVAEIRSILEPTSPHLFNLNSDIDQTNWPRVEPMQHSAAMARYQSV